jgi:hypothetical protein
MFFGHEPIIEVNERENKSELVCERCRAVLGDFVTNLRRPRGGATFAGRTESDSAAVTPLAGDHPRQWDGFRR